MMDKDRNVGAGKKIKGSIKETFGTLTGGRKTEAEGKVEKTEGTAQNTVGGVKDSLKK